MVDTIYALATPQGRAGVAVVRISGPEAFMSINSLCDGIKLNQEKQYFVIYIQKTAYILIGLW